MDCAAQDRRECSCTYAGCPRRGKCCECLHYHLAKRQLPACCFDAAAERSYDRSFAHFVDLVKLNRV